MLVVKLDNPKNGYYGGKIAAPVAKAVLQAAISARDASLDRGDLASQRARYVPPASEPAAVAIDAAPLEATPGTVFRMDGAALRRQPEAPDPGGRPTEASVLSRLRTAVAERTTRDNA